MKYIIVIRTYNAENYIKLAIDSVKKQTSDNWKCVIVNDASTDETLSVINKELLNDDRFTIITNNQHSGSALESFCNGVDYIKPDDEDVLIVLDGDDYLENNCIEILERYYTNPIILLTYGSYKYTHINNVGNETRIGYNVDDNIRTVDWRASHCRTFKYKLFKSIDRKYFKDENRRFYGPSEDLAMMFPLIETAGIENTRHVKEIIYNYNEKNPISDFRVKTTEQNENAKKLRTITPLIKQNILNKKLNIAVLTIATNKYIQFIKPLHDSIKKNFLSDHNVDMFCFTDKDVPDGVIKIHQEHMPFPYPTLMRYHIFYKNIEHYKKYDAVYYCDADMLFIDKIGNEVLSDLTVVKHPGFWYKSKNEFSYQRNPISVAAVALNEGDYYFAGGFNGGFKYLELCKALVEMIDKDLQKNICAIWHDESYLNRYLIDNKPTNILSPSYCFPDPRDKNRIINLRLTEFKPKLIALDKNHKEIRS